MKVLSVVGARPQFVKAAAVSRILRRAHTEVLVHTGQHYDDAMSAAFFRDLEIPLPDVNLGVGSGSHAAMTAAILGRLEPVVLAERPHAILLYGDTNSTLAAAVVGCKIAYPGGSRPWLIHVEAGLRSFNAAMPEERNRIVADHLSDLLLAPTAAAVEHLLEEGLGERTRLVGDVMVDSHQWALRAGEERLPDVARQHPGYALLTLHRAENVDDPALLRAWLAAVAVARPIIFPVHPRTAAAMVAAEIKLPDGFEVIEPAGYLEMVALEQAARAVITDSGGVQKEAYLSGVPCITLRGETEWVETVDSGWNRLVEPRADVIRAALDDHEFRGRRRSRPPIFGDGHAAERVVAALEQMQTRMAAPQAPAEEVSVT
jgi:UDP-N-acetylglucosamine 2-epimerase